MTEPTDGATTTTMCDLADEIARTYALDMAEVDHAHSEIARVG